MSFPLRISSRCVKGAVSLYHCKQELSLSRYLIRLISRSNYSTAVKYRSDPSLLNYSDAATQDMEHFIVIPDFVSSKEEDQLMIDIGQTLRGKKYSYDHWDGAIEGYRETEKSSWSEENQSVIARLKAIAGAAMPGKVLVPLESVHVLDLAPDGCIKPHVDSVKFCGEVICGISLLSDSVMQLQHEEHADRWIHGLLPRLSLYIMKGVIRYKYTHTIPTNEKSVFRGEHIVKQRRLSLISRTQP